MEHVPVILSTVRDLVVEWETVGTLLGIEDSVLQAIKYNCHYQVPICRKEMRLAWIEPGTATCPDLISALKRVRRHDIASQLKKVMEFIGK